jgi:hypothetical protein
MLPASLEAGEKKKPKLPAACADALDAAVTAFESFDVIFGEPGNSEDLGVLGDYISTVTSGGTGDAELNEMSDEVNAGQGSELDFLDLLDTCRDKVRL